ncbi:MAG TPA: LysR family transcriptional regulator [Candidatus Polarisedimenticolaceae bacterium]|nr:LysR family transcriptional regulator [Candidatus Polarisedimenticolaceae bacterium]
MSDDTSPPLERGSVPRADVDQLLAFVAVARTGSVGRAAEELSRTQPTISARLGGLEKLWGTRLFRRRARGMSLTPEGARLLPRAESILRELRELDRLAGVPLATADQLRVGAGDALARERLPRALAALLAERPAIEIQLREGTGPGLLDALRNGEIDLALVVGATGQSAGDGIDSLPLIRSDVVLLAPAASRRVPTRRRPTLEALARSRLVSLQRGSGFRAHLERAFDDAGLSYRPAVEVGNLSLVRRFVAAGLGVALVPSVAFGEAGSRQGVALEPTRDIPPLTYQHAVRRGVPLSAAARLLELLVA